MVYVFGSITTCIVVICTILNIRLYKKWKTLKSDIIDSGRAVILKKN